MKSRLILAKIWKWSTTALLIIIGLIVLIPSWRIAFQGWYQSWFLDEVVFNNASSSAIDEEAKNWQLFDQDDQLYQLEDFKGQPIVLNFWATWCPSCRAELPEIEALKSTANQNVKFLAVTTETPEAVEQTGLHKDYDYIYYCQDYPRYFQIEVYPTLIILNKNLEIVFRQNGAGAVNNEKNVAFLNALTKEKT